MILPNKYVSIEDSYIGLSARILKVLKDKQYTIDIIWDKINKTCNNNNKSNITFNKFTDVISFMYVVNMINYDKKRGVIYNENIKSKNN